MVEEIRKRGKHGRSIVLEKEMGVRFEGVQRGFLSEMKGKVILLKGSEDRNGAATNSEKPGAKNQETESTRSRSKQSQRNHWVPNSYHLTTCVI